MRVSVCQPLAASLHVMLTNVVSHMHREVFECCYSTASMYFVFAVKPVIIESLEWALSIHLCCMTSVVLGSLHGFDERFLIIPASAFSVFLCVCAIAALANEWLWVVLNSGCRAVVVPASVRVLLQNPACA